MHWHVKGSQSQSRSLTILHIMHLISGHPVGLTPGNPWAFAKWCLQFPPPTQEQYFSTKTSYYPSSRDTLACYFVFQQQWFSDEASSQKFIVSSNFQIVIKFSICYNNTSFIGRIFIFYCSLHCNFWTCSIVHTQSSHRWEKAPR